MFKKTEFEKLLVKNWTKFLEIRKVIEFLKTMTTKELETTSPKITTISVSNCFFSERGIIVWIDYSILNSNKVVNRTSEFLIRNDGNIEYLNSI
jgi:hypothetical protein